MRAGAVRVTPLPGVSPRASVFSSRMSVLVPLDADIGTLRASCVRRSAKRGAFNSYWVCSEAPTSYRRKLVTA
jgi:hypothetical protein